MEASNLLGGAGSRTFNLWSYIVLILTDSSVIMTRDTKESMESTKTKPKTAKPRMSKFESRAEIPAPATVVPIGPMSNKEHEIRIRILRKRKVQDDNDIKIERVRRIIMIQ